VFTPKIPDKGKEAPQHKRICLRFQGRRTCRVVGGQKKPRDAQRHPGFLKAIEA
jgi:hypothetical protein